MRDIFMSPTLYSDSVSTFFIRIIIKKNEKGINLKTIPFLIVYLVVNFYFLIKMFLFITDRIWIIMIPHYVLQIKMVVLNN